LSEGFLARSKMLKTLTGRGVLAQNSESYAAKALTGRGVLECTTFENS